MVEVPQVRRVLVVVGLLVKHDFAAVGSDECVCRYPLDGSDAPALGLREKDFQRPHLPRFHHPCLAVHAVFDDGRAVREHQRPCVGPQVSDGAADRAAAVREHSSDVVHGRALQAGVARGEV